MENINLGLDSISVYLKSERKQLDKEKAFVKTKETDNQILKAPEFLENVYKTFNVKKNDSKKAESAKEELNLLTDNKNKNVTLANKNERIAADVRQMSESADNNFKRSKEVIDEIYNQIKK